LATLPFFESRIPEPPPDGSDPVIEGFDLVITFMAVFGIFVWGTFFTIIFFFFTRWHRRKVTAEQWKNETRLRAQRERDTEAKIAAAKEAGQI